MRRFIASIITCLTLLAPTHVWANEDSHQALISELLTIMDAKSMSEGMQMQVATMMQNMEREMNITEDEQEIFNKHSRNMAATMKDAVAWEKLEPTVSGIYKSLFTEEELTGIIAFYKTPAGKAALAKMPLALQESMQLGQYMLEEASPSLRKIALELDAELKLKRAQ